MNKYDVIKIKLPQGWKYWGKVDGFYNFHKGNNSDGWVNVSCNEEDLKDGNLIWMMENGYTREK